MTNKLISLVILILILLISHSYSNELFLFPKEKPSIFKKIDKSDGRVFSSNLPQKKPINEKKEEKKEPVKKIETPIEEKKEIKKTKVEKKKAYLFFLKNHQFIKQYLKQLKIII